MVSKSYKPQKGVVDYESAYANFAAAAGKPTWIQPSSTLVGRLSDWTASAGSRALSNALKANHQPKCAFAYASVLTNAGNATEAVGLFKTYMDANPNDNTVRATPEALLVAKMYDQDSAYQEECKESCHVYGQVQEALRQNSEDLQAYQNLSRMYFEQGNFQMSQLCAEKAQMISKDDPGILNNRGVTFLEMDKPALAIVEFQEAIAINPRLLQPNLNLGWLALNSGDYTLALECFDRAVKIAPGNTDAKLGLAIALRGTKDENGKDQFQKAAKLYEQVIAAEPTNQMAYYNAATLHGCTSKTMTKPLIT